MPAPMFKAAGRCPYCAAAYTRGQFHESELVTCAECARHFVSHVVMTTEVARVEGQVARRSADDVARAYRGFV